jgi:hypothetical protein
MLVSMMLCCLWRLVLTTLVVLLEVVLATLAVEWTAAFVYLKAAAFVYLLVSYDLLEFVAV